MKKLVTLLGCALLSACANTNAGEISYRRASAPPPLAASATAFEDNCRGNWPLSAANIADQRRSRDERIAELRKAVDTARESHDAGVARVGTETEEQRLERVAQLELKVTEARDRLEVAEQNQICPLMLEARLDRQNYGFGNPIIAKDTYSLRLEHAMLAELSEIGISGRGWWNGLNEDRQIGEIVILANVFEFGSENPQFLDAASVTSSRVIYYSEDVEQYQDLNFHNLPLQAPVEYGGQPLGIQIFVLELDRVSEPAQALIQQLASLGGSVGLIPGGAVAETLQSLGSALLQGNSDDMVFEYRMILDPAGTTPGANSAPFEEGRYVMMRNEDRSDDLSWENYRIDHNTGRVYEWTESGPKVLTEHTYLTINVIKHANSVRPGGYTFEEFEDFRSRISDQQDADANWLGSATTRLQQELVSIRADELMNDLTARWNVVATRAASYSRLNLPDPSACHLTAAASAQRDLARIEATSAAAAFITAYGSAIEELSAPAANPPLPNAPTILTTDDQRSMLTTLAGFFVPFSGAADPLISKLQSPDVFKTAYLGAGNSAFVADVLTEMNTAEKMGTCEQLVANNLATAP